MSAPRKDDLPDSTILAKTGRTRAEWHAILDAFGCLEKGHALTARWLEDQHGVSPWWAQTLTLDYERSHGREVGRRSSAQFGVSVTRTLNAPVEAVWQAWSEPEERAQWDVAPIGEPRKTTLLERMLFGAATLAKDSRLTVEFRPRPDGRTTVVVTHEPLGDRETCDAMRTYWRDRLTALRAHLERTRGVRKTK
ncbi:MAG: hypothetical protein ACO1SV_04035 [Fimbriimonas sp.]